MFKETCNMICFFPFSAYLKWTGCRPPVATS